MIGNRSFRLARVVPSLAFASLLLLGSTARAQFGYYPPMGAYGGLAYGVGYGGVGYGGFGTVGGFGYPGYGLGYGGFGGGGFGLGGFGGGGFGGGGFGAYGISSTPYGLGFGGYGSLPPNPPSPYYVVPSGGAYLEGVRRRDSHDYAEIMLMNQMLRQPAQASPAEAIPAPSPAAPTARAF
jgi:hypothetical protein